MSIHWLGYAGTTLVFLAYLPQIFHLLRERCSAGLCVRAYVLWVAASLLLLIYAVSQNDGVFIVLQCYQLLSTGIICFFSKKYEHNLCKDHGGEARQISAATDGPMTPRRTPPRLDAMTVA